MHSLTRRTGALGLTILAVLTTGVVRAATYGSDYPAAWDARALPLVEFVENARGHRFKHPVPVSFLPDAEFEKKVADPGADPDEDREATEAYAASLRALGLLDGDVDLVKERDAVLRSSIVGLYVPEEEAVFVRGTTLDPYQRVTLVHELTHVLQDQYFDLEEIGGSSAVTALIEGDATRIEDQYYGSLSVADTERYDEAEAAASEAGGDGPEILGDLLGFPYVFGPVLLDVLTQEDGNAAVDRAFRRPPFQEAQVLDPVAYPTTDEAAEVPLPALPTGAEALDDGDDFGQFSLFLVLSGQLGYSRALAAVADWQGDVIQSYELDGRTCVAIDVEMGTSASRTALLSAAEAWGKGLGADVGYARDRVTIRACDPGKGSVVRSTSATSAFSLLAARASVIHFSMNHGDDYSVGRCIADGVITGLGPQRQQDLYSDDLSDSRTAELRRLFENSTDRCRPSSG